MPRNEAEWREAVNIASALRLLHDCKLYGLVTGGPKADIERCDLILSRGKSLGFEPDDHIAIAYAQTFF